jgi:hypothetical protein
MYKVVAGATCGEIPTGAILDPVGLRVAFFLTIIHCDSNRINRVCNWLYDLIVPIAYSSERTLMSPSWLGSLC